MLGKFFKKAKEAVNNVSDAVRGVEQVDWIHHAFPYSLEMMLDADEARDLSRPMPPANLEPAAVQYADAWYTTWAAVRDGHIAPVSILEQGNLPGAQQALAQWEAAITEADVAQARLGDFRGGRHLVLANGDVHQALESMVEDVRDYIGVRVAGHDASEEATRAISQVVNIHTTMNNALLGFYADPAGVAAKMAEDAAFAPIEAMRANIDQGAPEMQPILGVSLHDYVAGCAKLHAGMSTDDVAQVLGVERPQWDQASAEWMQRVSGYPMTVGMEYANLMSKPHPKFDAAQAGGAPSNAARLASDRDFYIECAAAMAAATEAGIDAGGYLETNYGVTVAQVASAGVTWGMDLRNVSTMMTLQEAKKQEIAAKIKAQSGPGIADDIQF